MALLKCAKCGGKVSELAKRCPHCNCTIEEAIEGFSPIKVQNKPVMNVQTQRVNCPYEIQQGHLIRSIGVGPLGHRGPDGVEIDLILHFVLRKDEIPVRTARKAGPHGLHILGQDALQLILAALALDNLNAEITGLVQSKVSTS